MAERSTLLIMVGPPGAGKTTFAAQFAKRNNFVRVNSDQVRETYFPELVGSLEGREQVYTKMAETIAELLHQNRKVIFDGNLLTNDERWQALERYQTDSTPIFFVDLGTSPATALRRAANRDKSEEDPNASARLNTLHAQFEPLDRDLPHITLNETDSYETSERRILQMLSAEHM